MTAPDHDDSILAHPQLGMPNERLTVPLSSPWIADLAEGRQMRLGNRGQGARRSSDHPLPQATTEVTLIAGRFVYSDNPVVLECIAARLQGRAAVRAGLADVITWCGYRPPVVRRGATIQDRLPWDASCRRCDDLSAYPMPGVAGWASATARHFFDTHSVILSYGSGTVPMSAGG